MESPQVQGLPPSLIAGLRIAAQARIQGYGVAQVQQKTVTTTEEPAPETSTAPAEPAPSTVPEQPQEVVSEVNPLAGVAPQSSAVTPLESDVQQVISEAMGVPSEAVQQPVGQNTWSYGSSWTGPANWGSLG